MSYIIEKNKREFERCNQIAVKIKDLYLNNKCSITQLAKEYKIERHILSRHLKRLGVTIINWQNIAKFDETIFDIIDTEEKAYWLGFLYADGCVSSRDNTVELSLQLNDKEHLEKFKTFLKWTGSVKTDTFRCRLSITNKHLKEILIKKGCIPKKSLTLTFPSYRILKKKYLFHFIRGYFDGDGSLYINKNDIRKNNISLLGTIPFITTLRKKANWKITKILHDKKHNKNTVFISYGSKPAYNILNGLYSNANIYLDRKYLKYKQLAVLYGNI